MIRRVLVLLGTALTLCLTMTAPANAALSERCGTPQYIAIGVTAQTCISADLSYVRGVVKIHVNDSGLYYFRDNPYLEVSSFMHFGPSATLPSNLLWTYDGPRPCVLEIRERKVYTCPAPAIRNYADTAYFTRGKVQQHDGDEVQATSPRVDP